MTKYDDADWHVEAAVAAGQPEVNAIAHVGLYLTWIVRNDLHDRDFVDPLWEGDIKSGAQSGSALVIYLDEKLVSDELTPEGEAFSDWYYTNYLSDYAEVFSDLPDYGVVDNIDSYSRLAPTLDQRYSEWIDLGRPMRPTQAGDWAEPEPTHHDPSLEALIPSAATKPPMVTSSIAVTSDPWLLEQFGDAISEVSGDQGGTVIAFGKGGRAMREVTAILIRSNGANPDQIQAAFRATIVVHGQDWETREISGKTVSWSGTEDWDFKVACWATSGIFVQVQGWHAPSIEALIPLMP